MARRAQPRSGDAVRKQGVSLAQCGHKDPTTGASCFKQGTFGLGPPMYPTEEYRCRTHRWPDYFNKERQWNT